MKLRSLVLTLLPLLLQSCAATCMTFHELKLNRFTKTSDIEYIKKVFDVISNIKQVGDEVPQYHTLPTVNAFKTPTSTDYLTFMYISHGNEFYEFAWDIRGNIVVFINDNPPLITSKEQLKKIIDEIRLIQQENYNVNTL